jgi:hypothetical protein
MMGEAYIKLVVGKVGSGNYFLLVPRVPVYHASRSRRAPTSAL